MITLPVTLEKELKKYFSRAKEREKFAADVVREALRTLENTQDDDDMISIGGTLHLFTDGGSRGNPGQAAIGIVLIDPTTGTVVREHYECIGHETNNTAEYRALIEGLRIANRYHPNALVCHLDSELVVKQLNGEYRVKLPSLKEFFEEIQELRLEFPQISFVHIPRGDNHHADTLVNMALDSAGF